MTGDIVERLRALAKAQHDDLSIGDDAADEIERLRGAWREALDKLMAAILPFAETPTTRETPGVAHDEEEDELIYAARVAYNEAARLFPLYVDPARPPRVMCRKR